MNELISHIILNNATTDMFYANTKDYTELSTLMWKYASVLNSFSIVYSGSDMHIKLIRRGEMRPFLSIHPIMVGIGSGSYTVTIYPPSDF